MVQPVPHVELQVFFDSQSNDALSGGAMPPSPTPPSPPAVAPPNVHVPPALQSHTAPVHTQSPVQLACPAVTPSSPPHAVEAALATTNEPATTTNATIEEGTMRERDGPLIRRSFAHEIDSR